MRKVTERYDKNERTTRKAEERSSPTMCVRWYYNLSTNKPAFKKALGKVKAPRPTTKLKM